MVKKKKKRPARMDEDIEERSPQKRAPGAPRMNLGIPKKVYRKVQVAAALNDMEANDWIRAIVTEAAARVVKKLGVS